MKQPTALKIKHLYIQLKSEKETEKFIDELEKMCSKYTRRKKRAGLDWSFGFDTEDY